MRVEFRIFQRMLDSEMRHALRFFPELLSLKFDIIQVGSIENETNLDGSDCDLIFQLNKEDSTVVSRVGDSYTWFSKPLESHTLHSLLAAFGRALSSALANNVFQSIKLLSSSAGFDKAVFSLKIGLYDYDILPALRVSDGSFLLLTKGTQFTLSHNAAAFIRISLFANHYLGLRELIRFLKLLTQKQWNSGHPQWPEKIPQCVFESIVLEIAKKMLVQRWLLASFTEIARSCVQLLFDKITASDGVLYPLNNMNDNLVERFRSKAISAQARMDLLSWLDVMIRLKDDQAWASFLGK